MIAVRSVCGFLNCSAMLPEEINCGLLVVLTTAALAVVDSDGARLEGAKLDELKLD